MANYIGKLSLALAALLVSGYVQSHGHHSHGKPMSEVEQQAALGVFSDKDVKDRELADWDGVWQSVYPYLQSGELDPVFKMKAKKTPVKHLSRLNPIIVRDTPAMWILSALKMA